MKPKSMTKIKENINRGGADFTLFVGIPV